LQVRANEITRRKYSGGAAQLRTSEGTLIMTISFVSEFSNNIFAP